MFGDVEVKMKGYFTARSLVIFFAFIFITGCNLPGSTLPEPDSAPSNTQIPPLATITATLPLPTATLTFTPVPTDTIAPVATIPNAYYVEEFDSGLKDWSYFLTSGDENKMKLTVGNGKLNFVIVDQNIWVYVINQANEYADVRLDLVADNLGRNVNNISLVCRQSDAGWYEFNISSAGVYNILAFDTNGVKGEAGYNLLTEGGSQAILTGKQRNNLSVTCAGNQLSLSVNGTLVTTIIDEKFSYTSGKIGVSVKSIEQHPVVVEIQSVSISQP